MRKNTMSNQQIFTRLFCCVFFILIVFPIVSPAQNPVQVWEDSLILPTYIVDESEVIPMFFRNQSYQGASRVIYPYALQDRITHRKTFKKYRALYLENEYIQLCVLPEIGGRLFYATDKTNGYEMFYRQHVIKPANIGMLGAWISGGIEFCVFHHHRASTNLPVDYMVTQNSDGSGTIWIGETEPRHRMKWTLGIFLYPGQSMIQVDGRLINCTENVHSMLYWANVATHVNENYQIIFPPGTRFAVYHAKNSFCHWPVTEEVYNGNPYYQNHVDASWWKNHPNPISFFAHNIREGFLAGYDYGKQAGTMHVCNPHIVTGAKLWEWGPGDYGKMWDSRVLTDDDGPYAELMTGAYSDNQPDYSWIKPYEIKTFRQTWYPIRNSRGAGDANVHGMVNMIKLAGNQIFIAANTPMVINDAWIVLAKGARVLFRKNISIAPDRPFSETISLPETVDFYNLTLSLTDAGDQELVRYQPLENEENLPLPEPVRPPPAPEMIESIEELYLTGLRIRQFYNARIDPAIYFQEGLKRDPLDTRCNTQMGIICKERGEYEQAADYFRKALQRLTRDYTHPRDCEPFYHLGIILKDQEKFDAAYDTLYKAAWDQAFAAAAYYQLAQISTSRKEFQRALEELNRSLACNHSNLNACLLKSAVLRYLGDREEAQKVIHEVLDIDILNFLARFEQYYLTREEKDLKELQVLMRDIPESYLEVAAAYLHSGLLNEASDVLTTAVQSENVQLSEYPSLHYYLGYVDQLAGQRPEAEKEFEKAGNLKTDYCFPFRLESEKVYQTALDYNTYDSKAWYYLGNLLYDKQPERAISCWEKAVNISPDLAIAHRNLGWGYQQTYQDIPKAIAAYEEAVKRDPAHAIYFYELDHLYELNGTPPQKRYELLVRNHETLVQRTSALLQEIKVLLLSGEYDRAIAYLQDYYFPRQEGVDELHDIYVDARLLKGLEFMKIHNYAGALTEFQQADQYPENHLIGRDEHYERNAQIIFYQALAMENDGSADNAHKQYENASNVITSDPEFQYFRALALKRIGRKKEAAGLFDEIVRKGDKLISGEMDVNFFAKFGEGRSGRLLKADGYYYRALGSLGRGHVSKARKYLNHALTLNPNHLWAGELLRNL
jgi:tetratricopeptide (TPR) repeat protein